MRKLTLKLLIAVVIIYTTVFTYIYLNQKTLLYFPHSDNKTMVELNVSDMNEFFVEKENGSKIQFWQYDKHKDAPTILYYHGNSYNLGYRAPKFRELIDMGYNVIAPSYDGFGSSTGEPSYENIINTAHLAVKQLQQQGKDLKNVIIVGESLGSGIGSTIAREYDFAALFLITPYTSISDRASEIYWYLPVEQAIKDNFSNIDNIADINMPVLLVHGTKDSIIPHSHSLKLVEVAKEPKKLIIYEGKGHSNLNNREIFTEMTNYFINELKITTK